MLTRSKDDYDDCNESPLLSTSFTTKLKNAGWRLVNLIILSSQLLLKVT